MMAMQYAMLSQMFDKPEDQIDLSEVLQGWHCFVDEPTGLLDGCKSSNSLLGRGKCGQIE
jgi:hypothetical protein